MHKTFDNIAVFDEQREIFDIVRNYADKFIEARQTGRGLIFQGFTGTGKSLLAALVLQHIFNQGFTGRFIAAKNAIISLEDAKSFTATQNRQEVMNGFVTPDLLVLDDMGTTIDSDVNIEIINQIVYERYQDSRPTIITTNDTLAELKAMAGTRVVDRMREHGGLLLPFTWESLRKKI